MVFSREGRKRTNRPSRYVLIKAHLRGIARASCTQGEDVGDQFQPVSRGGVKTGAFDDFNIIGRRFIEEDEVWWEIKIQPGKNGVYWIKGGEFYYRENPLHTEGVRTKSKELLDSPSKYEYVDPKEKEAALKAIK